MYIRLHNLLKLLDVQNIAEIDEIKFREHIEIIVLPAAERALERELDHTLRAQDMTMRRNKKTQSDRDQRIMKSLRESRYACLFDL